MEWSIVHIQGISAGCEISSGGIKTWHLGVTQMWQGPWLQSAVHKMMVKHTIYLLASGYSLGKWVFSHPSELNHLLEELIACYSNPIQLKYPGWPINHGQLSRAHLSISSAGGRSFKAMMPLSLKTTSLMVPFCDVCLTKCQLLGFLNAWILWLCSQLWGCTYSQRSRAHIIKWAASHPRGLPANHLPHPQTILYTGDQGLYLNTQSASDYAHSRGGWWAFVKS